MWQAFKELMWFNQISHKFYWKEQSKYLHDSLENRSSEQVFPPCQGLNALGLKFPLNSYKSDSDSLMQ